MVNRGIAVVITQGSEYNVEIRTGENLIGDIEARVTDSTLVLQDNTTCNWVREYGATTVYVTTPKLTDIYSKTEKNIVSDGVFTFPSLHVVSMDSEDGYDGAGTGDFYIEVNNSGLSVESNNVSRFYISGATENLEVKFYEAGGIFYGQELAAQHLNFYHRGSNDIYVNPVQSIAGDIYNIGNVICITHPPIVNVIEHYQGRLIFY